jgi:glycosyltransferase involved in cell wall biosynthesis
VRLAYVADGRSPIALNWIRHFVEAGHEVHLLSTSPCRPELPLASLQVFRVAFSGAGSAGSPAGRRSGLFGAEGIGLRTVLRHWLGPLTVPDAARGVREALQLIQPDLVHAMRVPFEGMLAAAADPAAPLLVSVWGNDFTLHAPAAPGMRRLTRRTLARASALHCDCRRDVRLAESWGLRRDVRLAESWGLRPGALVEVIPGNGGVRSEIFYSAAGAEDGRRTNGLARAGELRGPHPPGWDRIPAAAPVIVNPRGFRGYVRNDTFFRAIPRVLQAQPDACFVCPAMAGERPAQHWAARLGVEERVVLLPSLNPEQLGALFRRSHLSVSPSEHDGTPNTLLEAMACGSFPLAGDLESIREWIEPGVNGLLFDPDNPQSLAEGMLRALADEPLRAAAAQFNQRLIAQRGTYEMGMAKAEQLYERLIRRD